MNRNHKVSIRIFIIVALSLGVGAAAIGLLSYELEATSAKYEATLREVQARAREADQARVAQVTFKKEVQEWKDVLLRGRKADDMAKYSRAFHEKQQAVNAMATAMQSAASDEELRAEWGEFARAHMTMGEKYEAALKRFS